MFWRKLILRRSTNNSIRPRLSSRWPSRLATSPKSTFKRDQDLFNRKVIAAQDFDTASDTYRQSQATVNADQASLNALNALENFKIVKAPFDGIVTERDTDIGAFVPSGAGVQLFRMAQTSPLRVYINVPQTFARFVKPGVQAELTLNELPDRKFPAHVTNTAGAIDPASRTLLTELEVPNENEELLPGAYAQINLKLEGDTRSGHSTIQYAFVPIGRCQRRSRPSGR